MLALNFRFKDVTERANAWQGDPEHIEALQFKMTRNGELCGCTLNLADSSDSLCLSLIMNAVRDMWME